jgi:glycosyltransferase involved in cell wall biosynthesis
VPINKKMKIVIAHPTGNQNVRAAAVGFAEAGVAASFQTTIATFPGDFVDRLSAVRPFAMLSRRCFDPRIRDITETRPWLELGRLLSAKARVNRLIRHETGPFSIDAVYRDLDRRVAETLRDRAVRGATAIYAYEDGARFSFRKAKELGLQCFYDLPVGYWGAARMVFEGEKERWPEWVATLNGLRDSAAKLMNKDEEIRLADRIFVASQFTASTLRHYPGDLPPVHIVPYGFPAALKVRDYSSSINNRGALKLLFVGGLTQRKGIAYLFKAVEALRPYVTLTLVGRKPHQDCPALNREMAKHRWIPGMSHADVLRLMQHHDVLLFPSLFEGFGLVITEAMSQGTPVITTDRTAGPDLITHGNNGWIIEAGSADAIQESIENILCNRRIVAECGHEAMETARQRPWSVYGRELADAILNEVAVQTN